MLGREACAPACGADSRLRSTSGRLGLVLLLGGVTPISQPMAKDTAVLDGNPNIVARNGENRDCQYFGWSSWSSCIGAEAYGVPTGVHTRKRSVKFPERGEQGMVCSTPMVDSALCLLRDGTVQGDSAAAAVNDYLTGAVGVGAENVDPGTLQPCMLADWGMWSGCMSEPDSKNAGSYSCGYGSETRSRSLSNAPCILGPEVRDAFTDCELEADGTPRGCNIKTGDKRSLLESRLCPIGVCNVDCVVSEWSGFGPCSKTCGTGTSRRKRALRVSPGGSGLPCPHLVEAQNCHDRDCDIDCQVGDFSGWGRCVSIAETAADSGGHVGCARNRSRPVLVKRVGEGNACPKLQEFQNCDCPAGLAVIGSGGFWEKLKNSSSPLVSWIGPTGSWMQERGRSFAQVKDVLVSARDPPKAWGDSWVVRILWYALLIFLALLVLGLLICCCRCCCRCCCKKSKARKVASLGSDSGSDLDYRNDDVRRRDRPGCCQRCWRSLCCCCGRRQKKQTRAVSYFDEADDGSDLDTYAGSRYSNSSAVQSSAQDWRVRDANLEGSREGTPLLSDRPAAREIRPQPGPEAWRQAWQDPALMQTTASLPTASYAYGQGGQPMSGYGNGGYPRDYGQMGGHRHGALPGYDGIAGYGGPAGPAIAAAAYNGAPAAYATGDAAHALAAAAYNGAPAAYATGSAGVAGNGYGGRSAYGDGPTSYGTGATYGPVVSRVVERAPYNIIDTSSGSFIEPAGSKPAYAEYSPQPQPPQHFYQAGGGAGMRMY